MSPTRCYIVCCNFRSGSYLLCEGLASTGTAGYPKERFPPLSQLNDRHCVQRKTLQNPMVDAGLIGLSYNEADDAEYVAGILCDDTTPNGVFGSKLHWPQLADALPRLRNYLGCGDLPLIEVLDRTFPSLSYIWLTRTDKVAQAISWYRALCTGEFSQTQASRPGPRDAATRVAYDHASIRRLLHALQSFDNSWKYFFRSNNITPICLSYEQLTANYESAVTSTLAALGISRDLRIRLPPPRLQKQADSISDEWRRSFVGANRSRQRGSK